MKRNVLRSFLNKGNEFALRMFTGREFQRVGPATAKLRGPNVTVFVRGMLRSPRAADRLPWRPGTLATVESISDRYEGAWP